MLTGTAFRCRRVRDAALRVGVQKSGVRVLVLGGTAWLGSRIAATAVERGHEVVCLARGSRPVPAGATLVRADRERPGAYDEVGGHWDAVLDVARDPAHVRGAVAALDAARYVLVSTGNVYADHSVPDDESAPLLDPEGVPADPGDAYGMGKVACEQAVLERFGDAALVARSGLIGGPGDASGRSGYWPWRFAHPAMAGEVVVPDADLLAGLIDVRDLADWLVRSAESGTGGVFNAGGPALPLAEHLAVAAAVGGGARPVPAPERWLLEQGVAEWSGPRSLPLWLADPAWRGFNALDSSRAAAAGLAARPLEDTLRDGLAWEERQPAHPHGAGLSDDDERALLTLFPA